MAIISLGVVSFSRGVAVFSHSVIFFCHGVAIFSDVTLRQFDCSLPHDLLSISYILKTNNLLKYTTHFLTAYFKPYKNTKRKLVAF